MDLNKDHSVSPARGEMSGGRLSMGFFWCGLSVHLRYCIGVPYYFGLYCLDIVCYKVYGYKPGHAEYSKILF